MVTPDRGEVLLGLGCAVVGPGSDDPGDQSGQLRLVRGTPKHPHQPSRYLTLAGEVARRAHSGMFPCFFAGSEARLVRSARRPLTICTRVSAGRITAST